MKNKRLNSSKPKALPPASTSGIKQRKLSAKELREKVYLMEVEIAAAPRLAHERHLRNLNTVPPPDHKRASAGKARLTHAQLQARSRRQMLLIGEFVFGIILLAGAAAWAVKAWQAWCH